MNKELIEQLIDMDNLDTFCVDGETLCKMLNVKDNYNSYLLRKAKGKEGILIKYHCKENKDYIKIYNHESFSQLEIKNMSPQQRSSYKIKTKILLTIECAKIVLILKNNIQSITILKYINGLTKDNMLIKVIEPPRKEISFFNKLIDALKPLKYNIELQKSMFNGRYRIDGYIEDLKLAIEYDEEQHNNNVNFKNDMIRQNEIKNELGCDFVRLNYKNTDAYNIGVVMENITNKEKK